MASTRHPPRVAIAFAFGCLGAIVGLISSWDGDTALRTIMAIVGFAFGIAAGVFLIAIVKVVMRSGSPLVNTQFGRSQREFSVSLHDRDGLNEHYPGNPDPLSRKLTGWRLPSERH